MYMINHCVFFSWNKQVFIQISNQADDNADDEADHQETRKDGRIGMIQPSVYIKGFTKWANEKGVFVKWSLNREFY